MKKLFKKAGLLTGALFLFSALISCSKKDAAAETVRKMAGEQGDFYVLSVNPEGELPSQVKNPSIQVMFSEPVVALEKLGAPTDKSDAVTITPKLSGHFKWIGTSLLSFESEEAVIPQKEYFIQINPELKSIKGNHISGKIAFGFYTEELKFTNITAGLSGIEKNILFPDDGIPCEYAQEAALFFSTSVNSAYVAKELVVKNETTGEGIPFDVTKSSEKSFQIKFKTPLQDKQKISVTLPAGSSSNEGCRLTSQDQTLNFTTLGEMAVSWTDLEASSWGIYSNPVKIVFNHQIKENSEEEIASLISTSPSMDVTKENIKISGCVLTVYGLPVTFNSEYKLTVASGIEDVFGRKSETPYTYDITVPSARSYASFKDYGFHMLESQFDPKLVFEHQNMITGNSSYLVNTVRGVTDNFQIPESTKKLFTAEEIIPDVRMVEAVDLKNNLEKTEDGFWRGTINFFAGIDYKYKYRDWRTDELVDNIYTEKNNQFIQVTDLGLSVRFGYNKAVVLVTKLSDGKAVEGAAVTPYFVNSYEENDVFSAKPEKSLSVKTDKNGLAVIEFKNNELLKNYKNYGRFFVEARTDTDRAIFRPDSRYVYNDSWDRGYLSEAKEAKQKTFIFTDRGLYKPGETITFRGIDRTLKEEEYSPYYGAFIISLTDSSWNPATYITNGDETSESGTFWGTFKIPEDFKPGTYNISYKRIGGERTETIPVQIQFFERLRFEVKSSIPQITYFSGDKITAEISGNYLGGGNLNGASFSGNWTCEPSGFAAKSEKYKKLTFGPTVGYAGRNWLGEKSGTLNGSGKGSSEIQTGNETLKGMAYTYSLSASVTDAGNQMISTSSSVKVHPAKFYIGVSDIKGVKGFAKKGDTLKFDYYLVTPDEKVPSYSDFNSTDKIKIELLREDWKQVQQLGWNGEINTRYQREMVTDSENEISLKASDNPVEFSVKPSQGGSYILRVSTKDKYSSEVITEKRFYVTSSDWVWYSYENSEEISMNADKAVYNPGETAQILINSPLPAGKYMMTVEREGIISEKVFDLETASSVIEVPVEEKYLPNVYVTLSSYSVRKGKPEHDYSNPDLDKPKGYFGHTILHVDTSLKQFDITITPEKKNYRPGESATIKVKALKDGKPLSNAEITLMAVDRGVIDLINYHVADPVAFFYSENNFLDYCQGGDSRALLIDPVTYEIRNLFGGDSADEAETKDSVRKNFEPTALFVPQLITDENGEAEVSFVLPDSLTSYRITAIGVDKNNFGLSENELPVTNPISVREVLPRQLRIKDTCEAGVVITNMTDQAQKVSIGLKIHSGLSLTDYKPKDGEIIRLPGMADVDGEREKEVIVPANSTVPLMFMVKSESQGWITFEFTVHSDLINERLIKGLQIEKPYIFETVASIGEVRSTDTSDSNSKEEMIKIPSNIDDSLGSLKVTLDPTKLGPLQGSVDYVFHYPYGCLEQRSAAILPLAAFGDYIEVLGLDSLVYDSKKVVEAEVASWENSQLSSGAFPYWPGSKWDSFFVSTRIAEIIQIAEEHSIPAGNLIDHAKLLMYIEKEMNSMMNDGISRWNIDDIAYACYVLARSGKRIPGATIDKIASNENSDFSELCYTGLAYLYQGDINKAKNIAKRLRKFISETTRGIDITSIQPDNRWWSCFVDENSQDLATALMFFSKLDSEDQLNAKIVHSLLMVQNSGKGHYKSTSATSRVFVAIDSYIQNEEFEGLNFTATAELDGKTIASGKFEGLGSAAVTEKHDFTDAVLKDVSRNTNVPLNFKKDGKGTLYYTMEMKYAVLPEDQIARDEGLCVFTEIIDTETGKTVTDGKLLANHIYKEVVHLSTTKDREYVALRAPIPCGAEILNAAFATTGPVFDKSKKQNNSYDDDYSDDFNDDDYQVYSPLSSQAIYDAEVQYFWNWFAKGNQTVEFYFRPSRKGTFNTPCSLAECMYEEEIFGRTAGHVWKIQ